MCIFLCAQPVLVFRVGSEVVLAIWIGEISMTTGSGYLVHEEVNDLSLKMFLQGSSENLHRFTGQMKVFVAVEGSVDGFGSLGVTV